MSENILGTPVPVENNNFNTLAEAGVEISQQGFFTECFGDIAEVVVDSSVTLVTQPLLSPATNLEIIVAIEACQFITGINKNQLAWFLLKNKECNGWFVAQITDKVRITEDEEHSFVGEGEEQLVLRTVGFIWRDNRWYLYMYLISDPEEWRPGAQILSRKPSASQS